jgi:phage terminase large subunit-like protein
VRTGPKVAVDPSPLRLRNSRRRELAVARFASDYVRVPRGHGVRKPLRLRPWQRALIASTWDRRPAPRLAGWMLPRGQGKTSLTAVLALYELLAGPERARRW